MLEELGPKVQWLHSDVIDDKIYCVCETRWFGVIYLGKDDAPNDEIVLMAGTYTLYAGYTSMRGWVVIPTFLTAGMIRWH